jgi:MoaA/NifB/PqqE/SkfB family radical SAM enzyme
LRSIGLGNTVRLVYLDLSDQVFIQLSKRFPSRAYAARSVQIECTTKCNLKCTFCELSHWTEKPTDLTFANFEKMVAGLPKLRRVDMTGIGEALMNREFVKMVEFLKARGIYITLNDNFTLITEKTARRMVELGVDHIFLSLDGATKETYEQIRVGSNFDKVIANARGLVKMKRELRKRLPEIKINTVVCETNYQEMPAIVELAHDIGIGMVVFVNVITFEETAGLDTVGVQREVQSKLQEALRRARELGVVVKMELFEKEPVERCDFPWRRNFVTYDGYVHPCCYTTQTGDRKAQNGRSLGNLLERPFEDIWNAPVYAAFREKMGRGVLPSQCGHCPRYSGKQDLPDQPVS